MTSLASTALNSQTDRWINGMIAVGSAMFVFGLGVSAAFAPEWRVLHLLQAFIYVVVVMLTRRQQWSSDQWSPSRICSPSCSSSVRHKQWP